MQRQHSCAKKGKITALEVIMIKYFKEIINRDEVMRVQKWSFLKHWDPQCSTIVLWYYIHYVDTEIRS